MAIFFSLLYIFTAYLTPTAIFGDLAAYHVEQVIVVLAVIASLFHASGSNILKMSQTYGVVALLVAIAFSLAFNGLTSAAPSAVMGTLSDCIVFFLILWNFRTRLHLQVLVAVLLLAALISVVNGAIAFNTGVVQSKWIFIMGHIGENPLLRIRGLGMVNDPNDFCQFLVGLIPCVFIFWRGGHSFRNLVFVLLPVAVLLYGMFLTHSRGGMVGLLAGLMLLGRRKFGLLPAAITAAIGFVALSAIGWSGGREIDAESGADRTEAWATGLKLIRSHPVFGVGIGRFPEYFHITAHNTVVVCAAELGMFGFFFWTLMVVPTFYELAVARNAKPEAGPDRQAAQPQLRARRNAFILPALRPLSLPSPAVQMAFSAPGNKTAGPPPDPTRSLPIASRSGISAPPRLIGDTVERDEIRRLCGLMTVSLTGFFAAGWFLSRSYTIVLFVNIGIAVAVHRLAVGEGLISGYLPLSKAAKYAGIASIVLIAVVYILLRVTNLLPKS